jgi:hypothetical protein
MKTSCRSTSLLVAVAGCVALLSACTSSKSGPGQLEVKLVDAPNPAVDQIVVHVAKVTAHSTSAGWITVGPISGPTAVNLLDLQTTAMTLGLVNLPAGKITQLRLIILPDGNYVVPTGSTVHEPLIVPSGIESGIKILGPWDVPPCTRLTVTLDFDGKSSIEYHQADGTWILRPVVRPTRDGTADISCEPEPPIPPIPPSPPIPGCSLEAPCVEGEVCISGTCAPATPLSPGSECTSGPGCLSGICNDGVCAPGGTDFPCQTYLDCASRLCIAGACG